MDSANPNGAGRATAGPRRRRRTPIALLTVALSVALNVTWADSALASTPTSAVAATTSAAATTSGPITGYEGLCLDDESAGTADKNPVDVYTCNGTAAQTWTLSGGNLLVLGKCLGPTGGGTANGTVVDIYTCNGTAAQLWQPQSNGELLNTNSGKCLDDTGYGGSGTQAQIWTCGDTANQEWVMPTGSGGGSGSGLDPSVAPGGNFDLSLWELQLPTGSAGDPTTILPSQLEGDNGFQDSYFYTGADGSMTFWDPENGVTTPNSNYSRSELREMTSSGAAANWFAAGTTNKLSATVKATTVPSSVCVGQIHLGSGGFHQAAAGAVLPLQRRDRDRDRADAGRRERSGVRHRQRAAGDGVELHDRPGRQHHQSVDKRRRGPHLDGVLDVQRLRHVLQGR